MEVSSALVPFGNMFNGILNGDPVILATQVLLGCTAALLVYLVFYTTRDILARTNSLGLQLASILLVAALPVVGFSLYFLIRPSRTLNEKRMQDAVHEILTILSQRKGQIDAIKYKAMNKVSTLRKVDANESIKKAALSLAANAEPHA